MKAVLFTLTALYFLSHALRGLYARVRVPEALVVLGLGLLAGPWVRPAVAGPWARFGPALAFAALLCLAYWGGLSLRFRQSPGSRRAAGILTSLQLFVLVGLGTLLASLFQHQLPVALFAAVALAPVSASLVGSWLAPLGVTAAAKDAAEREARWGEAFAVLAAMVLMYACGPRYLDLAPLLDRLGPGLLKGMGVGLAAGLLWGALDRYWRTLERIPLGAEAWLGLTVGAAHLLGVSEPFAAFTLGLVQGNWREPLGEERLPALAEAGCLLRNLFLLHLGLDWHPGGLNLVLLALLLVPLAWIVRYGAVQVALDPKTHGRLDAVAVWAPAPRGLGALALAAWAVSQEIPGASWVRDLVHIVVPLSLALTAVGLWCAERPTLRVSLHRIFGRYKEDFGLPTLGITPADPVGEVPAVAETPERFGERERSRRSAFPELKLVKEALESDDGDDGEEIREEPTIGSGPTVIDLDEEEKKSVNEK